MTKADALRRLRTVLAQLFTGTTDASRIAEDAGLNLAYVQLDAAPINTWRSILSEADKRNKVGAIVSIAIEDYPENTELEGAYQAYLDAGGPIDKPSLQVQSTIAKDSASAKGAIAAATRPVKILFLAANPLDTQPLQLDEEIRAIDRALRQAEFRTRFELQQHWAVRYQDLQELLLRHRPDIVHFSGHSSTASEIMLQNEAGDSHPISVRALSTLFSILKDNIRCVVLNACYSEVQAQAIAQSIEAVIGMNTAIGDRAAITFAAAFYQGLGYGRNLKTAFELGCSLIDLANLDEQDTPQLLAPNNDPAQIFFIPT